MDPRSYCEKAPYLPTSITGQWMFADLSASIDCPLAGLINIQKAIENGDL